MIVPSLFFLALLAIPASAASDFLSPTRTTLAPRDSNPIHILTRSLPHAPAVPLTNAQRLSRGLPPNRPRLHRRVLRPRQSQALSCQTRTGIIQISVAAQNPLAGYLSRSANSYAEYELTSDPANALQVSICQELGSDTFDIRALNGLSDFDYLGAARGFSTTSIDLSPGSYNYVYITGTEQVPRGPAVLGANAYSAATGIQSQIQSNLWRTSPSDPTQLTTSWVNSDGTVPDTQIVYVLSSGAFAIVGDLDAFTANFGPAAVSRFTFVPLPATTS